MIDKLVLQQFCIPTMPGNGEASVWVYLYPQSGRDLEFRVGA